MNNRQDLMAAAQRWERNLKSGDPNAHAAFAVWVKSSPEHLRAYMEHMFTETEIAHLDADCLTDLSALPRDEPPAIISQPQERAATKRSFLSLPRWRRYATAASLLLLVASAYVVWSRLHSIDYVTGTGEQRRIMLADGSRVDLNTQSHLRVSLGGQAREVELLEGEALFTVHHDSERPFRVHVRGNTTIEDLGTEFDVRAVPGSSTSVAVLEGRVQIAVIQSKEKAPVQVSAGQAVRIADGGQLLERSPVKPSQLAWRQHQLQFDHASLAEIATEFNRYNKVKIEVDNDPLLSMKKYSLTFDVDDPSSFLQALSDDPTLDIAFSESSVLIRAAVPQAKPDQR